MLLSFSGESAMISLAAAIMIQKIADSSTAIVLNNAISILVNYKTTLATLIPINCQIKYREEGVH